MNSEKSELPRIGGGLADRLKKKKSSYSFGTEKTYKKEKCGLSSWKSGCIFVSFLLTIEVFIY